jgi:hypothetical protein
LKPVKVRIEHVLLAEGQAIGRGRKPWWDAPAEVNDTRIRFRADGDLLRRWALELTKGKKIDVEVGADRIIDVWTGDRPPLGSQPWVQVNVTQPPEKKSP